MAQRDPFLTGGIPSDSLLNLRVSEAEEQSDADMALSILKGESESTEDQTSEGKPDSGTDEPVKRQPLTDRQNLARMVELLTDIAEAPAVNPGFPIARAGRVSTNSSDYQQLALWTVSVDRIGKLLEIAMVSNTPVTAQFQLRFGGIVQFTNLVLDAGDGSLTMPFEENELLGEMEIELLVVSDGSITIIANGMISGVEKD